MEYTKEWQEAFKNKDYRFKVKAEVGDKFLVLYKDNISFDFGTTIALDIDDRTGAPRFVDNNGAVDFCSWFKLKPIESWIPKQGEMIKVWDNFKSAEREFIAMTTTDEYLCWSKNKSRAVNWPKANPIKKKPIIERRWKMRKDHKRGYTYETHSYYNQKSIDMNFKDYYKGSYIDVELKDK